METNTTTTLGETLRNGALYERAPSQLHAQILAQIAQKPRVASRRFGPFGWLERFRSARLPFLGGGVAGLALGAALALMIVTVQAPMRGQGIEQEIVASHVRALISSRDIDVISTDQHTVKPWFNGRIDYAPPVIDTRDQGFPLVGGRLDYIDHRPVAVMIYRYLKHPIDLYVFPEPVANKAAKDAPIVTRSSPDGYALAEWRHDGMVYWAVTDASPVYIDKFAHAIARLETP